MNNSKKLIINDSNLINIGIKYLTENYFFIKIEGNIEKLKNLL